MKSISVDRCEISLMERAGTESGHGLVGWGGGRDRFYGAFLSHDPYNTRTIECVYTFDKYIITFYMLREKEGE